VTLSGDPETTSSRAGPEEDTMTFRMSIAPLMSVVLVLAVGFAALRLGSETWSSAVFTLTLVLHLTAILGAIYRRDRERAGWLGFALFGWGYLILSFGPGFRTEIRPQLATAPLLDYLFPRIAPIPPAGAVFNESSNEYYVRNNSGVFVPWGPDTTNAFQRSGHSLIAVHCGFMGALVARAFAARYERAAAAPALILRDQ
jgi:hypothetical protein